VEKVQARCIETRKRRQIQTGCWHRERQTGGGECHKIKKRWSWRSLLCPGRSKTVCSLQLFLFSRHSTKYASIVRNNRTMFSPCFLFFFICLAARDVSRCGQVDLDVAVSLSCLSLTLFFILFFSYFFLLDAGCWGDVTHCGQVDLDVAVSLSCLSLSHSMSSAPSRSPSSSRLKKKETCSCM
jgi:hypothetical protein